MKTNTKQRPDQLLLEAFARVNMSSRGRLSTYSLTKNGDHLLVTRRSPDPSDVNKKKAA